MVTTTLYHIGKPKPMLLHTNIVFLIHVKHTHVGTCKMQNKPHRKYY